MIESILSKLSEVSERYIEIENLLSQPDITSNQENYIKLSKEYSDLSPIVKAFKDYEKSESSLDEAKQLVKDGDPEIREMAEIEIEDLTASIKALEIEIKRLLLPKDPDDSKDVFLEVRAGAGGDEAALFAGDLFRMYSRLSERNNWNMDVVSIREGDHGGYKELVTRIEGNDVYKQLKFEAGVHRVQRVPATESQGRVHTSACSVAVLPEMDEIDEINIDKNDLRVDTFRASGAGGQHVNKTESAVRLTHEPTGVVVECQDGRSQHANYDKAMKVLRSKLYELEIKKQNEEIAGQRKSMVGSGDRSDKIRTYNYPQARVTDHRINHTVYNLTEIVSGDLFSFTEKLRIAENAERMKAGNNG